MTIPFTISTKGRNSGGRWYPRPDRISIFVNVIAKHIDVDNPRFEARIGAISFHEVSHIKGYRSGCHPASKCREGDCYFCGLTEKVAKWIL